MFDRQDTGESSTRTASGVSWYSCWYHGTPLFFDTDHILDWLVSSVLEDAGWLRNVDDQGRPKKLMKCSTFADLEREADKAMDRKNAQAAKALGPDDEQHVADLEERFRLVRLLTPEALDLESRRMHHCVGHGSYDEGVASGNTEIYSMRDPQGRPVITMEVYVDIYDDGARRLQQVKGKRNNDPEDWQADILQKWLQTSGWGNLEFHFDVVADNDCRPDRGLSWCRPDHCDGP